MYMTNQEIPMFYELLELHDLIGETTDLEELCRLETEFDSLYQSANTDDVIKFDQWITNENI